MSDKKNQSQSTEDLDYQVGAHDVDKTAVPFGQESDSTDEDFYEFGLEVEAVFKRLAQDIYKSDRAGIREPLTNAVTAVKQSIENDYLSEEKGVITFRVKEVDDGVELVIQDNGMGITEKELKEVVSVIGRSTVRDRDDLAGKFGMGFLAMFRLVGTDGGFIMHTKPRRGNSEQISGAWKSGGFTRDTNNVLDYEFGENQYGTRFEMVLKQSISADDVESWVEKYAEWSRIPVIFEYISADGRVNDETYGGKELANAIPDNNPKLTIDNEYFTAVSSPEASRETILLDVPLERNAPRLRNKPYSIDIRFRVENGIIVDGPNEGLRPVSKGEYNEMSETRKKNYIPKDKVSGDDIVTPSPTGTRDSLGRENDFWYWLEDRFKEIYEQNVKEIGNSISTTDDLFNLDEPEYRMLTDAVDISHYSTSNLSKGANKVQRQLRSDYDIDVNNLNQETKEVLALLQKQVGYCPRGKQISQRYNRGSEQIKDVICEAWISPDERADVYMSVKPSMKKTEYVWEQDESNVVITVDSTDQYDFYSNWFGWKKLRDVNPKDEEDKETGSKERTIKDPEEKVLSLHMGGQGGKYTVSVKASELASHSPGTRFRFSDTKKRPLYIVLFPTTMERGVSNYYWLSDTNVGVARCTKKVWQYLKDDPQILLATDFINKQLSETVLTNDGEYTIGETLGLTGNVLPESVQDTTPEATTVFHVVPERYQELFRKQRIMDGMHSFISEKYGWSYRHTSVDVSGNKMLYAPVTVDKIPKIGRVIQQHYVFGTKDCLNKVNCAATRAKYSSDTIGLSWALLDKWRHSREMDILCRNIDVELDRGGYFLVNSLRQYMNDQGIPPLSEQYESTDEHLSMIIDEID